MNTFIIYSENELSCSKLNINIWNSRKNKIQYFDFGFMFKNVLSIQSIKLVVPIRIERKFVFLFTILFFNTKNILRNRFGKK